MPIRARLDINLGGLRPQERTGTFASIRLFCNVTATIHAQDSQLENFFNLFRIPILGMLRFDRFY